MEQSKMVSYQDLNGFRAVEGGLIVDQSVDLAIKRLFDIVVSLIGIVLSSPLALLVAAAIYIEDRHNPIFSQRRVGYHGKDFTLYKFRSMCITSEQDGKPQLCAEHDQRLTRIGRFIREHHLDEMPQLWNVLKGDMSLVGHRPERRYFVDQITALAPEYELLYRLRPGVFSYATLYNGYTDNMGKMLKRLTMDLRYLYTRNIWVDIRIILLTLTSILRGKKF